MATTFTQKKNNAKSTITNNPLTAGGLTITLASSTGAKFPTTGATWLATIWDAVTYADPSDDPNMEIVLIDSRSTDTLTVNASGRGYAGTTAVSHATGSAIRMLITASHFTEHETAINTLEASSVGTYTAWTTVTAPVFQTARFDNGAGGQPTTTVCRYTQIGKTVIAEWKGSGRKVGTGADTYIIGITSHSFPTPVYNTDFAFGAAYAHDNTATAHITGIVLSLTNLILSTAIADTHTLDLVSFTAIYEVA
jgi:hypothetical protein